MTKNKERRKPTDHTGGVAAKAFLLVCLAVAWHDAAAQYIRLSKSDAPTAIYIDASRIFNYNRYEHARVGAGFYVATPSNSTTTQWQLSSYVAYGFGDKAWKYGVEAARTNMQRHKWRIYAGYNDDLSQNGMSYLEDYSILHIESNIGFTTSSFVRQRSAYAGVSSVWSSAKLTAEGRYIRQHQLFRDGKPIFPALGAPLPPPTDLAEARLRLNWPHLSAEVRMGNAISEEGGWLYSRLLLQYAKGYVLTEQLDGSLFAQVGYAVNETETETDDALRYINCFDLSGTYNSHFFFRNSLLTIPPNCFISDAFTRITARMQNHYGIWQLGASSPKAFVQLTAVAGRTCYSDGNWALVAEPAIGIDELIRFGMTNIGVAAAWQMINTATAQKVWQPETALQRIALLITASLSLP